jgi:hypothetical protein
MSCKLAPQFMKLMTAYQTCLSVGGDGTAAAAAAAAAAVAVVSQVRLQAAVDVLPAHTAH